MEGHAQKRVERYCELASTKTAVCKVSELESVGELSKVCSQVLSECFYVARIGRPDILWSVNKLAKAVTKWTRACEVAENCLRMSNIKLEK